DGLQLFLRFDAFRNDDHVQTVSQEYNRLHNCRVRAVEGQVLNKEPVDLDGDRLQVLQPYHGRISGPEIIHDDVDPALFELSGDFGRLVHVDHRGAFRQLELDQLGRHMKLIQSAYDFVKQLGILELPRRQVHRDGNCTSL